jgi:hypothetical protein
MIYKDKQAKIIVIIYLTIYLEIGIIELKI